MALVALRPATPTLIRRVAAGTALYSLAAMLGQVERSIAAAHRNPSAFLHWSYEETAAYLVIVLLWILALPRPIPEPGKML